MLEWVSGTVSTATQGKESKGNRDGDRHIKRVGGEQNRT